MKTVTILIGPHCSGKTEFARKLLKGDCTVLGQEGYENYGDFTKQFKRTLMKDYLYTEFIYLDGNFISKHARNQIYNAIKETNTPCNIEAIIFKTPLSVCIERNSKLNKPYKEKTIRRQLEQLKYPFELKPEQIGYHIYEGGGTNDVLLNRHDNAKPSNSNIMGNSNTNAHNRNDVLDPLRSTTPEANPYLEFVLRARTALQPRSRRNIISWFKRKNKERS